jgi:hypothetical protein
VQITAWNSSLNRRPDRNSRSVLVQKPNTSLL